VAKFTRRKKSQTVVDMIRVRSIATSAKTRLLNEAEHWELMQAVDLIDDLTAPAFRNDESTKAVCGEDGSGASEEVDEDKPKRKGGNGRKKPTDFSKADLVSIPHPDLKHGEPCPCGCGGKVYRATRVNTFRHFVGRPPIQLTIYETEVLHCRLCDSVYPAPLPAGVGPNSYDATAVSVLALGRYGTGIPVYRQAAYVGTLGVPIAASTQYEVIAKAARLLEPVYVELKRIAAQGKLTHFDDTGMKILKFVREAQDTRTGIHTTGVLSIHEAFQVGLYLTGRNHAGENMAEIDKLRNPNLPAMIKMSDALASNFSELDKETGEDVIAACMGHGRRNFVKIAEKFPVESRRILLAIGQVYHYDKLAREQELSPEDRLTFHQAHSKPVMADLKKHLQESLQGNIEPNSTMGSAMKYMMNHWEPLTLFLRVAGAPLDNNPAERMLKKAVLHRKNSLFYRTLKGAHTGDVYMSLIYTCQLNKRNPFDYLTELQRHSQEAAARPSDWLPWTYEDTMQNLHASQPPS